MARVNLVNVSPIRQLHFIIYMFCIQDKNILNELRGMGFDSLDVIHLGLYGNSELKTWFEKECAERVATKLDMAINSFRFKKIKTIPYDLIAELCRKMAVEDYIRFYEQSLRKTK